MFDIGMPEFMVIAVVAMVVIGPERLPAVMGKIGRTYRQLRTMSNELIGEARAQWEEGMKEVEGVSSTISDAWQEAASDSAAQPNLPPPPVYQVPVSGDQPQTAAAAGPWALHAMHRVWSSSEVEVLDPSYPEDSPFALPRRAPAADEAPIDDAAGGPMLMGPAPTHDELAAWAYDLPEAPLDAPLSGTDDVLRDVQPAAHALAGPVASSANGSYGTNGAATHAQVTGRAAGSARNTQAAGAAGWVQGEESVEAIRERTIIDLYRKGALSAEAAAIELGVPADEFLAWVELALATEERGTPTQ
jgi:sec-independent protein translocase protein TatB